MPPFAKGLSEMQGFWQKKFHTLRKLNENKWKFFWQNPKGLTLHEQSRGYLCIRLLLMIIDNFKIEIINNQYLLKGMRGREKDNRRFKQPWAQNEVEAAMSEVDCSRNMPSINGEPPRAEQGWKQKKHAMSSANEGDCDLCRNYTSAGEGWGNRNKNKL